MGDAPAAATRGRRFEGANLTRLLHADIRDVPPCAAIATLHAAGMFYAGGVKFILLSALVYAPGTIPFVIAKGEQCEPVFTPVEWLLFDATLPRRWSASTASLQVRSRSRVFPRGRLARPRQGSAVDVREAIP